MPSSAHATLYEYLNELLWRRKANTKEWRGRHSEYHNIETGQHRAKLVDSDGSWQGKLFCTAKVDAEREAHRAECQVCRPTCHIFMCACVQSEPHREARGELISILDSRLAAGPKRHVGCRSDGQYSPSFRGIFPHFHRASDGRRGLEGRGKGGRDEGDALPSSRSSAPEKFPAIEIDPINLPS